MTDNDTIETILNTPSGPVIEYSQDDVDAYDGDLPTPAGWTIDYSSQTRLPSGRYRAPLTPVTAREIDSLIARLDRAATALREGARHWDRAADERALVALAGEAREAKQQWVVAVGREASISAPVARADLRDARERLGYAISVAAHHLESEGYYRDAGPPDDAAAVLARRARIAGRWPAEQQSLRERLARATQ